jgi:hypothetical protein
VREGARELKLADDQFVGGLGLARLVSTPGDDLISGTDEAYFIDSRARLTGCEG